MNRLGCIALFLGIHPCIHFRTGHYLAVQQFPDGCESQREAPSVPPMRHGWARQSTRQNKAANATARRWRPAL